MEIYVQPKALPALPQRFTILACLLTLMCLTLLCSNAVMAQQAAEGASPPNAGSIIFRDVAALADDTFSSIARRELGKSGLAPHLAAFNGLSESSKLVAGQLVRIPIYVVAREEFAKAVFVKGEAWRNDITLLRDDEVHLDDLIRTGNDGFVSLEFSSGSVVNMQPATRARLVRLNCLPRDDSCLIHFEAERGNISSDVESRDNQPTDFRIRTPYASAAVRGTAFDVNANDATLRVGVTEGDVRISAQDANVDLARGTGSVTREGEPPGEPIPLLQPPVYRNVPTRVAPGDFVAWWDLTDATTYQAQLTADSLGNGVLAEFATADTVLALDHEESGDFFLYLRAIDDNGLLGFSSSTPLTVASIDPDLEPIDVEISRNGNEFLVSVIDPPTIANGFEIQVATSDDFEIPLSVDVNRTGTAVFRLDDEQVFARARTLMDPVTVSAFGGIARSE